MNKLKFKGRVKPYFFLEVLGRDVVFGDVISLGSQHVEHKSVRDALRFGWLVEVRKFVMHSGKRFESVQPVVLAEEPVKRPQGLDAIIERQTEMLKGIQRSYEVIQREIGKRHEAHPVVIEQAHPDVQSSLKEMLASQKLLWEVVNAKFNQPNHSEVIQALNEIKENLKDQRTQAPYNTTKPTEKDGFNVQHFEEKYVAKIDDFDVKESRIQVETHKVAGTDDALAALKKLKGK